MVTATYIVELATTAGVAPTTWTDITGYVKSISITRGRDDVLSQVQVGTASLTLDNTSGTFSPANTFSTLYPHVAPMRAVRITATPGVVGRLTFDQLATYTFDQIATWPLDGGLYYGYIQSITPRPHPDAMEASIELADGMSWLDLAVDAPTYTSGLMGAQVTNLLDTAGWAASARIIATGVLTFTPTFSGSSSVLSQLQTIVNDNEGGLVFMNGAGSIVAQDQGTRFAAPYLTSMATVTSVDDISDMDVERPVRDIANEVTVTYNGGTVTKTDATSSTKYGPRRLGLNAAFLNGTDADDWASWVISQKKDPKDRLRLTFIANRSLTLLVQAVARELSDRITWTDVAQNTGTSGDYNIESIEHQIEAGGTYHAVTWTLSPVVPYSRQSIRVWWTLGTSTLGTGTRLAY